MRQRLTTVVAVGEALTGLVVLMAPALVTRLLFGAETSGAGSVMTRFAGVLLISLGVACWPGTPRIGLLVYSVLAALLLGFVGLDGGLTGALLWPAVLLHVILAVLLARGRSGTA